MIGKCKAGMFKQATRKASVKCSCRPAKAHWRCMCEGTGVRDFGGDTRGLHVCGRCYIPGIGEKLIPGTGRVVCAACKLRKRS